jgi:hypothetical protein
MFDDDDFVSFEECAERMNISLGEVVELVRQRALKAQYDGWRVTVEPAITNIKAGAGGGSCAAKTASSRTGQGR